MNKSEIKVITKNNSYSVITGSGIIKSLSKILKNKSINFTNCLLIVDRNVPKNLLNKIKKSLYNKRKIIHFFNANEKNKNQKSVNSILQILLKNNFHRNDCVIAIGGGITGDVSAFAASVYKRGLNFINIPTTLLAQVDSSIGGKTGINSKYGKNLIGSFYQPAIVLSDTDFLKTLSKREIICGYGEILKHSLIANKKFFNFLNKNVLKILDLKSPYIEKAIHQSCLIKKKIIQIDERENGIRKILNFGHTFAHAYEGTLKYSKKLNHGEAVILGIASAIRFSLENNLLTINSFNLIMNHLNKFNLYKSIKKKIPKKNFNEILNFMLKDKKNNSEKINLILLTKIGEVIHNLTFSKKKIKLFIKKELAN